MEVVAQGLHFLSLLAFHCRHQGDVTAIVQESTDSVKPGYPSGSAGEWEETLGGRGPES